MFFFHSFRFETLFPILRENPPDVIVYDSLSLAGEALARALNVPAVEVAPHATALPLWCSEADWTTPILISGLARSTMTIGDRLSNAALMAACCHLLPLGRGFLQREARERMGLPSAYTSAHSITQRTQQDKEGPLPVPLMLLLGNTLATEYATPLLPNVVRTGPFLPRHVPQPQREEELEITAWLDRAQEDGAPVVYAAIGTNSVWSESLLEALISAFCRLGESGAARVLMMINPRSFSDSTQGLQQRAMASEQLKRMQRSGAIMLKSFSNQFAVLGHPAVSLFVTHAGLGSVHEALYHGVPMVMVPMMLESDQPTNAARLQELGLGAWIDRRKEEPSADEVHAIVSRCLSDAATRHRLEAFQQYLHATGGAGYAAALIESAPALASMRQPLFEPPTSNWFILRLFLGVLGGGLLWIRFVRRR